MIGKLTDTKSAKIICECAKEREKLDKAARAAYTPPETIRKNIRNAFIWLAVELYQDKPLWIIAAPIVILIGIAYKLYVIL